MIRPTRKPATWCVSLAGLDRLEWNGNVLLVYAEKAADAYISRRVNSSARQLSSTIASDKRNSNARRLANTKLPPE
jgi:hypothetical protein